MFSGSYLKSDVEFLLKVIDIDFTELKEKEQLIQNKKSHYSEMISKEYEPSKSYLDTFYNAFELNKNKFAKDILILAYNLSLKTNITLVSLVRAGTPIGVLIKRVLSEVFQQNVNHYSISIIRDREIDNVALKHIVNENKDSELIFIDGWTGKGVINKELKVFIKKFNLEYNQKVSDKLYVLSDIAGVSDYSVNNEDYFIPSSALNSTVSGLVSRSILNDKYINEGDFHGCKYYKEYKKNDLSLWFVNEIMMIIKSLTLNKKVLNEKDLTLSKYVQSFISKIQKDHNIHDVNFIKPGIAETTRVLLRRIPYLVIVKDIKSKDIQHIVVLTKEKNVEILEDNTLPYLSLAIIKNIGTNNEKS